MNFELTPRQLEIRESCRQFVEEELKPRAKKMDETSEFPYDLYQKMAEKDWLGMLFAEKYGGTGDDTLAFTICVEEISRGDVSLGVTLCASPFLAGVLIDTFGTEEQKQKWLVPMNKGEKIGAFGLTEHKAGSDAGSIQTTAVLDGDEWIINGSKEFITNAGLENHGIVIISAVTGKRPDGKNEISNFIIPKGTPGYIIGKRYEKLGWRASDTRKLIFKDCRVPKKNMLGEQGAGFKQFLHSLDVVRIGDAAMALGLAQACLDAALSYSKRRCQFNQPLANFQVIQHKLADMALEVELARLMTYRAAWQRDNQKDFMLSSSYAKIFCAQTAKRCADQALQIHGAYGTLNSCAVSRFYRNAKLMEIASGTSEILKTVVAIKLLREESPL